MIDTSWKSDPEDPQLMREHWRIMEKPDEECDSRERAYKKMYTYTKTCHPDDYQP